MNRREALALLSTLATVASVEVCAIKRNDVIVVESDNKLSPENLQSIQKALEKVWPDQKIVVLDQGLHLRIATDMVKA